MENIKIGVQIDANTKEATADAKKYHDQLKQVADAASKIKVGGVSKASAQPSGAMAAAQPTGSQAIQQYGSLRGTAGATGASARDFANQAQGLTGLVRLYAIYAANVYAAGAAFQALSRAMDTTNMVRGLNQIGAASGVALGALSKELADSTGNAISLREAMSATVKVTAAGLGSENVLRLGQVAAKASQALGVDMTDAVNRLSRGITKLEPELLDELGIFTKIDPAVQKYALSVGKTASQLTDFERRQAFANAVLEEGEKKFAAIKVDANPYNKLAAAFENLAQSGLELVNKVLSPVANFLSSSPTALVSIISLFGLKLVQQVIPALSEFKTGLESAAAKSTEVLRQRVTEAQEIRKKAADIASKNLNIQIEREIEAVNKAEEKMQALRDKRSFSFVKSDQAKAALATLQDPGLDPTSKRAADAIKVAQEEAERISKLRRKGSVDEAKAIAELANNTQSWGTATKAQQEQTAKLDAETKKLSGSLFSVLGINTRLAESSEKSALRNNIVQTAAYNGSIVGLRTSISILREEIEKENITGLSKAALLARGSFAALTGAVSTLFSALSKLFFYVGIIVAVYEGLQLLYSFISQNAKEQKAFGEALDKGASRLEAFGRTVEYVNKLPFAEQLNTASVGAKATAIAELSTSIGELAKTFEEQQRAAGAVDKSVDKLKGLFGFSTKAEKFSEALGKNLFAGLKNAGSSKEAQEAKKAISEALELDISTSSEKQVIEAITRIANNSQKVDKVNTAFKTLSTELNTSASRSKELKTATEELDKAYKTFFDGLKSTDSFDILAEKQKAAGIKLLQSLADPERALTDLIELINNPVSAQLFGSDAFDNLQKAKNRLEELNEEQARNIALINDSKEAYRKAGIEAAKAAEDKKRYESTPFVRKNLEAGKTVTYPPEILAAEEALERAERALGTAESTLAKSKEAAATAARSFAITALDAFDRGSKITSAKIEAALSKGATIVTDNLIGALGDLPGAAALRAENDKQQLASQAALIRAQLDQINETRQNTLAVEKSTLERRIAAAQSDPVLSQQEIDKIVQPASAAVEAISKLQTVIGSGPRAGQQAVRAGIAGAKATLNSESVTSADVAGATEQLKIFDQAQEFIGRQAALYGQLNEIAQKTLSIEDTKKIAGFREQEKILQNIYDRQLRGAQSSLQELQTQESLSGFLTEQERAKRDQLQIDVISLQQSKEVSQLLSEITSQEFTLKRLKEEQAKAGVGTNDKEKQENKDRIKAIADGEQELSRRKEDLAKRGEENEEKIAQQQLKNLQDRQRAEKEVFEFNQKSRAEDNRLISEQNQLRLEAGELELTRLSSLEEFNKRIIIDERARIDTLKLQAQEQTALNDINVKAVELEFRKKQLAQLGELGVNTQEASRRLEIESTQLEAQRNLIINKNSLQFAAIEQTRQLAQEQERYNQTLQRAQELSEAIKTAFEGIGTAGERIGNAFSNLVTVLANMEVQSKNNAQNVSKYEETVTKAREAERNVTEPDDANAAYASRLKAEDDLAKAKSKQAKDELTANAKVVGSVKMLFKEKTGAYKILGAVEKAMHLTRLAMEAKELFTKITGIKLGLAADVAGEAKETAIDTAGFLSRVPTMTTEILGKITSQLGIFGPPIAATLIAAIFGALGSGKSMPAITAEQQQSVQGTAMGYNAAGEKVQVRSGVFGDVDAKSQSIANSLEIIRDNSVRGMDYNDKLLKSFERLSKNIETVAIQAYQQPGLVRGKIPGIEEGTKDSRPPPLVSFLLGGAIGLAFFGKKVTTEVIDSGIKLQGSFLDIAKGAEGVVEGFATVKTTTKRGAFGKKRVSVADAVVDLDPKLAQAVTDAFGSALDTVYSTAEVLDRDLNTIDQKLEGLNLRGRVASLRGLKGEELAKELQAFFSSIIDEAFEVSFEEIAEAYRKFGEGAAETVSRVADTNRKINQQLGNISGTGIAKNLGLEVTEALADAAGGLQSFIQKTDGFIDKFLTDAEKLAPVQASVSRGLDKLGLGWIKTREQFKQVVLGLKDTNQQASDTYIGLINISEGFDQVTSAAEKAFDSVKSELKSVAEERISELKGARDEFQGFAKSLREYQLSLKTGSLSPLTPQQQYEELRREFLLTQQAALAGDTGAIGKLSSVSGNFLQASQKMFASSAEYLRDFDMVSSSIDSAASFAEQQVDIANSTLSEIKNVVGGLVELKTETQKVPVALSGLGTALTTALAKYNTESGAQVAAGTVNVIGGTVAEQVAANTQAVADAKAAAEAAKAVAAAAEAAKAVAAAAVYDYSRYYDQDTGGVGGVYAMGAAFDRGVQRYARGGVVNGITPFQHQGGLGIMGEAGPEAIMPLQRMPGGNLGVQMSGDFNEQLAKLNQQVLELTQVVANGAVMNAQATDRNTEAVVAAVADGSENTQYQTRLVNRTRVV